MPEIKVIDEGGEGSSLHVCMCVYVCVHVHVHVHVCMCMCVCSEMEGVITIELIDGNHSKHH